MSMKSARLSSGWKACSCEAVLEPLTELAGEWGQIGKQ